MFLIYKIRKTKEAFDHRSNASFYILNTVYYILLH